MLTIEELQDLRDEVVDVQKQNREARREMAGYALQSYLRCLLAFGPFADISKDCFRVIKEYNAIINEENRLLSQLMETDSDVERIYHYFCELDEASEQTIEYYFKVLDDIDEACEMRDPSRGTRGKKGFYTLTETDDYRIMLDNINITFLDVMKFLDLPDEFWNYIDHRIEWAEPFEERSFHSYYVSLVQENGVIKDISVTLPPVVDLESARTCIHELKTAYEMYCLLGQFLSYEKDREITERANNTMGQFKNKLANNLKK